MSEGQDDNWEMPQPVFRSSPGSAPRSFEETISQSFSPDKTGEIDEDDDILGVMDLPTEEANVKEPETPEIPPDRVDIASQPVPENAVRAKAAGAPAPKTGVSMTVVFVVIVILAAAAAAAYYFLIRTPADTTIQ